MAIGERLLNGPVSRVDLLSGKTEPVNNGGTNAEALKRSIISPYINYTYFGGVLYFSSSWGMGRLKFVMHSHLVLTNCLSQYNHIEIFEIKVKFEYDTKGQTKNWTNKVRLTY